MRSATNGPATCRKMRVARNPYGFGTRRVRCNGLVIDGTCSRSSAHAAKAEGAK